MEDKAARTALQWAVKALSRRMLTVAQLKGKLARKGYPPEVVDPVVERLIGLNYLDDAQFAERWVHGRSRTRMLGRVRLVQELRHRGVDDQTISQAVRDHLDPDLEVALARKAAERKKKDLKPGEAAAKAALLRHLRSRGFSNDVIRRALEGESGVRI